MLGWAACVAIGTFATSLVVTRWVREVALRRQMLDRPNERSAHVRPTPRLGGIGIMAAFLPAVAAVLVWTGAGAGAWCALLANVAISGLGLVDDLRPLPARWRLAVQLLVASMVVLVNLDAVPAAWDPLDLPLWLGAPISVLWIVWLTNLYNFMDGIDGLAAGQAAIAGAALLVAAVLAGATIHWLLAAALVGAALGFLTLNFPPASIFMGDVGSTAIGFFFGCLPFVSGAAPLRIMVVGMALALFILDATTTLVRRLGRGEKVFQAHRSHLYQRPLACGVGHRTITVSAYLGMVIVAAAAVSYTLLGALGRALAQAAVVATFLLEVAIVIGIERRFAARGTATGDTKPAGT